MLRFLLSGVGVAVALQAENQDVVQDVQAGLGQLFHQQIGGVDKVHHQILEENNLIDHLTSMRDSEGLDVNVLREDVHKMLKDRNALNGERDKKIKEKAELLGERKDLKRRIKKFAKSAKKLNGKIKETNKHIKFMRTRVKKAAKIHRLLIFLNKEVPTEKKRMNAICKSLAAYLHNYEHGSVNYEPIHKHGGLEIVQKECKFDVKEFHVGKGNLAFCVEDKSGQRCDKFRERQEKFSKQMQNQYP